MLMFAILSVFSLMSVITILSGILCMLLNGSIAYIGFIALIWGFCCLILADSGWKMCFKHGDDKKV